MEPVLAHSVRLADDGVHVLDRRSFPFERTWVRCATVADVAKAIEDMVTQSSGPYFAVLWGMVLAAREASGLDAADARAHVGRAGELLEATRRTNNHLRKAVAAVLTAVDAAGPVWPVTSGTGRAAARSARPPRPCCPPTAACSRTAGPTCT